jgi:membrane-associated protease RseP (regulator of RpoE activity)
MKPRNRKPTLASLLSVTVFSVVVTCATWAEPVFPDNGVNETNGKAFLSADDVVAENTACGGAQGSIICRLGICVRPVTSAELRGFGVPSQPGLVVTAMRPKSPLVKAGVELRDILLEVEGEPLDGPNALSKLMSLEESKRQVLILLAIDHRRGKIGFLHVTLTGERFCGEERP